MGAEGFHEGGDGDMKKEKQVVTNTHEDRRYKDCLCCVCNQISKCTPTNDFYSTEEYGNKLLCENCFRIHISKKFC